MGHVDGGCVGIVNATLACGGCVGIVNATLACGGCAGIVNATLTCGGCVGIVNATLACGGCVGIVNAQVRRVTGSAGVAKYSGAASPTASMLLKLGNYGNYNKVSSN